MAIKKNFESGYYNFINNVQPDPCYFIKFDLSHKDTFNELVLYHKNFEGYSLVHARDFLKTKNELIFEYSYLNEWVDAIENFSNCLNGKAFFKAWCEDEFIGAKDYVSIGYA